MLRQCILNNIDLIAVDNEFEKEYKENLYIAQTQNNLKPLVDTFYKCQKRLDNKLKDIKEFFQEVEKINNAEEVESEDDEDLDM